MLPWLPLPTPSLYSRSVPAPLPGSDFHAKSLVGPQLSLTQEQVQRMHFAAEAFNQARAGVKRAGQGWAGPGRGVSRV